VRRLFGTSEQFEANVRGVLELRLAQVPDGDPELRSEVADLVEEVQHNPRKAARLARNVAERALDIIWQAELPDGRIPQAWIAEWKHSGERVSDDDRVPKRRGPQCGLLRLMTGTDSPVARFVTRPTALLVDHLKSVGDFGHHKDPRDEATCGFAVEVGFAAIELLDSLRRDLVVGTAGT
jgi:hypothetical protein